MDKVRERIVVKIGSSTLTAGSSRISHGKIEDLARQLLELQKAYEVILVSSGAVAAARQFIDLDGWGDRTQSRQALAAIGQPQLMQLYSEVFRVFGLRIAQCLLTYRDVDHPVSRMNTFNTLNELLKQNYIPIVNENDTVAVEELIVGDNDQLSAYVATLTGASQLIIASDIDGLYDKNPHVHKDAQLIREITDLSQVSQFIEERENGLGTGGMTSKFKAAEICLAEGIEVKIVNGGKAGFIVDCLRRQGNFTRFHKLTPGV